MLLTEGRAGAVSRRRVLQGAAWATPAVLIASAIPAAAASGAIGKIALYQTSATATATTLYARVSNTYAGDGAPSPDLAVTNVRTEISVPTSRVVLNPLAPANAPTFTGAGWAYTSAANVGANTVYTFTWQGTDLSSTFTSTTQLVAAIPKRASMNTLAVGFVARGKSNALDVVPASGSATALNAGVISFAQSAANRVTYDGNYNTGVDGRLAAYRVRPTVRNTGVSANASRPEAAAITGITATVIGDNSNVTGAHYARNVGAGWTLTSGPTLIGQVWTLVYTYSGAGPTPGATTRDTTRLDFMMAAIGPRDINAITITLSGTSAGVALSATHSGPLT